MLRIKMLEDVANYGLKDEICDICDTNGKWIIGKGRAILIKDLGIDKTFRKGNIRTKHNIRKRDWVARLKTSIPPSNKSKGILEASS